jgi:hypothetical protein
MAAHRRQAQTTVAQYDRAHRRLRLSSLEIAGAASYTLRAKVLGILVSYKQAFRFCVNYVSDFSERVEFIVQFDKRTTTKLTSAGC